MVYTDVTVTVALLLKVAWTCAKVKQLKRNKCE